jgi:alpha-beta hydrolase superfamily lysophospholipase
VTAALERIEHREGWFRTTDGLDLFEQSWHHGPPRAVVQLVHGHGEHGARHAATAALLAERGFAVRTFDLRGHGRSAGRRCCVRSFDEHLDDLEAGLSRTRGAWPGVPVFLLGHSMGGLVSVLIAADRRPSLSGLVLSAPAVRLGRSFSTLKITATLLLGRVLPRVPTVRFPDDSLSRDPEVVRAYRSDPLVYHGRTPARTASELILAVRRARARFERIELPLLVMHGGDDRVAEVEGSRELHARARSEDKRLRIYDGLYHEILNEPERAAVLGDLTAWLREHTEDVA